MVRVVCYFTFYWPDTIRPPLPKLGLATLVKTCIANCGQMVPDTGVVCTDSLRELASFLPNGTIVDPLKSPLPQN